ncbi:hypothetical protein ACJX0J_019767, partial [Zea mays]
MLALKVPNITSLLFFLHACYGSVEIIEEQQAHMILYKQSKMIFDVFITSEALEAFATGKIWRKNKCGLEPEIA